MSDRDNAPKCHCDKTKKQIATKFGGIFPGHYFFFG